MGSTLRHVEKAKMALRYGVGLPRFFFRPLSLEECYALVRRRLAEREQNFLAQLRRSVYFNPQSPYYKLFKNAGCEYGDVERMLRQKGLEGTCIALGEAGIYITIEEYKGKKPVQRPGLCFQARPEDFDNLKVRATLQETSGGTRGQSVPNRRDFTFVKDEAAAAGVMFDELGLRKGSFVLCHNILAVMLLATKAGMPPAKWFLPLSSNKNRLASYYAALVGKALGLGLARPERFSRQEALHVSEWLARRRSVVPRSGVWTSASSAVRICLAAQESGLDISGTHFITGSEPLTRAREQVIRAAGCTATARYASTETGRMGYGCTNSTEDDVHVLKGAVAMTQQPHRVGSTGVTVKALRITSLLPTAPKILINLETGDYGTLETRRCGCRFDELGLTEHLKGVRSYEKLTSEGMTFFAGDLARIVEEVLPSKFGGSPLDYQAIEEEGRNGLSHLAILVSPRLGEIDEFSLVNTVLMELKSAQGSSGRMMAAIWEEAGTVRVRRQDPHPTKGGKVFPFQVSTN
ncbi:MAG TPA: hypothetical protein VNO43_06875 [Candidatus Eisenbacteria bacterium]|nr:hypothetical protein [Candidatus Eisenbacteria bacterium]